MLVLMDRLETDVEKKSMREEQKTDSNKKLFGLCKFTIIEPP